MQAIDFLALSKSSGIDSNFASWIASVSSLSGQTAVSGRFLGIKEVSPICGHGMRLFPASPSLLKKGRRLRISPSRRES
jgi:hypothetical protein